MTGILSDRLSVSVCGGQGAPAELRRVVLAVHSSQHGVGAGLHWDVQVGKHTGVVQHLRTSKRAHQLLVSTGPSTGAS